MCAGLVCSGLGHAADKDAFVQFRWLRDATAINCPEQAPIEQRVVEKLGRDPFAPLAVRKMEARIAFANGSWHVELLVRDADGPVQGRRIFDVRADAGSCDKVADAVGLAVALAIDPSRAQDLPTALGARRATSEETSSLGEPPLFLPAPETEGKRPQPQVVGTPQARTACPSDRAPWATELSLRGLGAAGLLPGVSAGVGMLGTVGRGGLKVALEFSYFPEAAQSSEFSFGLSTIGVGLCGELVASPHIAATWCGALQAGAMHAVVTRLEPLQPGDRIFAALSTGPKFEWRLWAPLFVEGGISAWIPLSRPTFALRGVEEPLFESRAVSGVGFLGIGWRTN